MNTCFKKGCIPWNKGLTLSKEGKKKLSMAHKGQIAWNKGLKVGKGSSTSFRKGFTPWNKGLKGYMSGEKNHLWRGGITPENIKIRHSIEYRLWREAVFARDHWNCQNCGHHGDMHAHHIKGFAKYPELRFAIDNGITLCIKCHKKLHTGADAGASMAQANQGGNSGGQQ